MYVWTLNSQSFAVLNKVNNYINIGTAYCKLAQRLTDNALKYSALIVKSVRSRWLFAFKHSLTTFSVSIRIEDVFFSDGAEFCSGTVWYNTIVFS